jgi:hypothetical protein
VQKTSFQADSGLHLKATVALSNLLVGDVDPSKLGRLVVRQSVHPSLAQDETGISVIDREHVDRFRRPGFVGVGQLPACAAVVRVVAFDGGGGSNQRELGKGTKGGETFSLETIFTVGASDDVKRIRAIVVDSVISDRSGGQSAGYGGIGEREQGDRSEGNGELHDELGLITKRVRKRSGTKKGKWNVAEKEEIR